MQKGTELQAHDYNVGNVHTTYVYSFEIHMLNNVWSRIMDSINDNFCYSKVPNKHDTFFAGRSFLKKSSV